LHAEEIQAIEEKQGNLVKVTGVKYRTFKDEDNAGSELGDNETIINENDGDDANDFYMSEI